MNATHEPIDSDRRHRNFSALLHRARRGFGWVMLMIFRALVLSVGRRLSRTDIPRWLTGPSDPGLRPVDADFHIRHARRSKLVVCESGESGLLADFEALDGAGFAAGAVSWRIHEFYERTGRMKLAVTRAGWRGPVGYLARAFIWSAGAAARNLELPLSSGELASGLSSRVLDLLDPTSGEVVDTCWLRRKATGEVVYSGFYGVTHTPRCAGPCVKTSFPIPGGWITVVLRPRNVGTSDFELVSGGRRFGEAGFYVVMNAGEEISVVQVPLHESIRLFVRDGALAAEHAFNFLGTRFLALDYAIRDRAFADAS